MCWSCEPLSTYLPPPEEIRRKHAFYNIQNSDILCFLWFVIAVVYGDSNDRNPERVAHYRQWELEFNVAVITIPMALKDIAKFERMNNISVSVYGYKEGQEKGKEEGFTYPLCVAKEVKERHVNLLLISIENTLNYCLIKTFN